MLGDDENYSYVPFFMSSLTDKMSLMERTENFISSKISSYFFHDFHLNTMESIFRQFVDQNAPSFVEMEKNISLVFINTHSSFTYPRSLPPQVIEVVGLVCRPAKPLPPDMEDFISESGDAGFALLVSVLLLRWTTFQKISFKLFFKSLPVSVSFGNGKDNPIRTCRKMYWLFRGYLSRIYWVRTIQKLFMILSLIQ